MSRTRGVGFITRNEFTEPSELLSRAGSNRAPANRGYPSGEPIPAPNNADWNPYARRTLGTIGVDAEATHRYQLLDTASNFEDDDTTNFDILINMPVGYKTNERFMGTFCFGIPLGFYVEKLTSHMLNVRGYSEAAVREFLSSIVLVGKFYRIVATPVNSGVILNPHATAANPATETHSEFITSKTVRRDLQEYSLMQFPLSKVMPAVGGQIGILDEPNFDIFGGNDLSTYVERIIGEDGGSNAQFFIFNNGAYFAKRYVTAGGGNLPSFIRNSHIMRTAGLRQIILKEYDMAFTFKDTFFERSIAQYRLYIPGGSENCFLASIRWFLLRKREALFFESLELNSAQEDEVLSEVVYDEKKAVESVNLIMNAAISNAMQDSKQSANMKQYLAKFQQGFPTSEMKKYAKFFWEKQSIYLNLWKRSGKGRWENILKLNNRAPTTPTSFAFEVVLFLMDDTGKILNIQEQNASAIDLAKTSGMNDGTLGHMLHCVSVYPAPNFFMDKTVISMQEAKVRSSFCREIASISCPLLVDLYAKNKHNPEITSDEIKEYVIAQNERYSRREVSTLIFLDADKASATQTGTTTHAERKRKRDDYIQEHNEGKPRSFVYAYDLETVDNTADVQEKVYPAFRKEITPDMRLFYDPLESQIPFSAQWVGVNLDDSEKFLERKMTSTIIPLDYTSTSTYVSEGDEEGKSYFITNPTTDYGEHFLLGECIESFLVDIAIDTHSKGGTIAYLYATNGSKFDAYVVLQFQRFEISKMLKTSRGILSATLRVPIIKPEIGEDYNYKGEGEGEDSSVKISIVLRDISLIVPGSLSRLCKGFDVPKKYCKQDFPIQMVNANNCYNPAILKVCKEYGEGDVCALAVILKKINLLIGNSVWNPAEHTSDKPPVIQFLTCMSMIRSSMKKHFDKELPKFLHPRAVDIPVLRNWISMAAIGGRVTSYARTYTSTLTEQILEAYLKGHENSLQTYHKILLETGDCMQCLDFTSLYPFVMDSCPHPMGAFRDIDRDECEAHIEAMHCGLCDAMKTLCPNHRYFYNKNDQSLRPFSIIVVRNVRPFATGVSEHRLRNLCPRKTYNASTGKPIGLNYSLESNEEFFARTKGKEKMMETQSFTNVDLYWMRRQGFLFDVIGGMTWTTTMVYNSFIGPAFQLRIEAKKAGNKLLSDFMKLNYNGSYGVTIQQDIIDSYFICTLEEEYKNHNPLEVGMREAILKSMRNGRNKNDLLASEELTGESFYFPSGQSFIQKKKKENLAEFYASQSPMQVGAAVLSYARHIGNLVLFNLSSTFDYVYTDTDSIAMSEHAIKNDISLSKLIINRDEAPMGSMKNDHADNNGTEPRIFLGLIGGKKVKCYFTLNAEGEVRIFNTFKGLNVSLDLGGKKIRPEYADYITAKAILNINETFTSEAVEVQAWKRDLSTGVSIGNHIQNFERETYSSDMQGVIPRIVRTCGELEYIIPHGEVAKQSLNPLEDQVVKVDNSTTTLPPPRLYNNYKNMILETIEKYYEGCNQEYHPGTEEYTRILALFKE